MDLLERYLAAVAALLPKSQREDIVAELRDTLLNQMEEKEAQLGRPLTAGEREAVLKAFGHPIAVAGRFGASRALIGPEIYPFYVLGVKALLVVAAVVSAIPVVISLITDPGASAGLLARFLSSFFSVGLTMIGAATVLGVGVERGWIPLGGMTDWKVADLPDLDGLKPRAFKSNGLGFAPKKPMQRRFEGLLEVIVTALFILWWTGLIHAPWAPDFGSGGVILRAAPVWATLYWPILGLAALQLVSGLCALVRPGWVRVRAAMEILGGMGGVALAAVLWRAGRLVVVSVQGATGDEADRLAGVQTSLDLSFHITATVMMVVLTVKIVIELWRLFRAARPAAA